MATIYDMASGKIISANECSSADIPAENISTPGLALQTLQDSTPIEDMSPVDAYMVLLQNLLKKL